MRVLHVIEGWSRAAAASRDRDDAPTDAAVLACAQDILDWPDDEHHVALIGPISALHRAAALGLHATARLCPPAALPSAARRGLAAFARARGPFDIVRAWSPVTADLAQAAGLSFGGEQPPWSPEAVACAVAARAAPDRDRQRDLLRAELREALVGPVVGVLADTPSECDGESIGFLMGVLEYAEAPVTWIVPAGAAGLSRTRRFRRAEHLRSTLIETSLPAAAVLPAFDAVLIDGRRGPGDAVSNGERLIARLAAETRTPTVLRPGAWGDVWHGPHASCVRTARTSTPIDFARALMRSLGRTLTPRVLELPVAATGAGVGARVGERVGERVGGGA